MRYSSESFDRSVQLKHCYHDSHHNWIFFFIFFHLQSCLLLLWDFSEWHQHKDLCYFNTVWKSLQAKESFGGSDGKEENWVRSLSQKDPLEKEMATHSNILAWKIPWMEEPGRLQFRGLQRVGHN